MNVMELYKQWSTGINFDLETKAELLSIKDDPDEIRDRFYKELDFGTGGIRGIVGAGTNRMNVYVVRKISYALAKYLSDSGTEHPSVMIGYDSRNFSYDFAKEAAAVFAGSGIKVYMHSELCPVPAMSYSIRLLKCTLGVLITASHNPKEYNGYKVFGADGSQLSVEQSNSIKGIMDTLTDYSKLPRFDFDFFLSSKKITKIGINIKNSYLKAVKRVIVDRNALNINAPKLKLVYTPLHGAGANYIPKLLKKLGFKELYTVRSQMVPDGNFSTVKVPNPEDGSVYEQAIKLADEKGADLILATDPDADRTGAAVKNEDGEYVLLNGNQIGVLLLDYIITGLNSRNRMPEKPFVVSTIVSTRMTEEICRQNDIEYINVFTGFKYIGGEITKHEENGDKHFLFGFEESYGYLPGSYARDKDAVATCILLAECAAYYNDQGMNLLQALNEVYKKYGYYCETQVSLVFQGESGLEKSYEIMRDLRKLREKVSNMPVKYIIDYLRSEKYVYGDKNITENIDFEKSDVVYYNLGDSWFCIRPSGTEPKIKIYFGSKSDDMESAKAEVIKLKDNVMSSIKKLYE